MTDLMNRRDLLKLAGMGVAVFVSGTTVRAGGSSQKANDSFYFLSRPIGGIGNPYGRSFYPPAPQFADTRMSYSDTECFGS